MYKIIIISIDLNKLILCYSRLNQNRRGRGQQRKKIDNRPINRTPRPGITNTRKIDVKSANGRRIDDKDKTKIKKETNGTTNNVSFMSS